MNKLTQIERIKQLREMPAIERSVILRASAKKMVEAYENDKERAIFEAFGANDFYEYG